MLFHWILGTRLVSLDLLVDMETGVGLEIIQLVNYSAGSSSNVSHEVHSPFHLIDYFPWRMTHAVE